MNYFKNNPDALPILLGTLIFIAILVFAGVRQGSFNGSGKAPAPAASSAVTVDSSGNRPSA